MKDVEAAINALAREQHGLVEAGQLHKFVSEWGVRRREVSGRLVRVAPSVYRVGGAPPDWETRALGGVLSCRAPALVSHLSAAYLYGLDGVGVPGFIDITVPRHRRPRKRAGLTVHESLAFDLAGPRIINRVPVTGVARTLLDCFAVLPSEQRRLQVFDDARRRRLVSWDELWECLLIHTGRGRRGLRAFRDVLVERNGETPPGSDFSRRVAMLIEGTGLPRPAFEYPAGVPGHRYRLDLAWPPQMIAVECLGRIAHDFEKAYEDDPVRRNRIRQAGWHLLEITWRGFLDHPEELLHQLRVALAK